MLHAHIREKTAGSKLLLRDFELRLNAGEKIGFIGRNGTGKTTLFRILLGTDTDYDGEIEIGKTVHTMTTDQEHHGHDSKTTVEYLTDRLPHYTRLKHIIETYPSHMGEDMKMQARFSDAIMDFSERGYYDIENEIEKLFTAYQLDLALIARPFSTLSGGQKRLVDLIAIQIGKPTLALLDEPTNHMDYIAKEVFLDWLKEADCACIVISHDRDVLQVVERIVELRDMRSYSYPGNYDAYLKQNSTRTLGQMQSFETTEKRIDNIKEQIRYAKVKAKSKAGGNTGRSGKNQWVVLQQRLEKELAEILEHHEKPSFWIDRESAVQLAPKLGEKYEKYKARNIRMKHVSGEKSGILLDVHNLQLGYETPLFSPINFQVRAGDKLQIIGRNGAGKTTLVRAIMDTLEGIKPPTLIGRGVITTARGLHISLYEQELGNELHTLTLYESIEHILYEKNVPANDQVIRSTMSSYLFNPEEDKHTKVSELSGGQKARLQLIRMLAGDPSMLILDEPTNHLDLPSIEELETALQRYKGAVMYISHDSYFSKNLGGDAIKIIN
jgi:ATPase subunit of ABC transporter with duplicated ATPase domains